MATVKEWLEIPENVENTHPNKLSLILDNLNTDNVAVKGNNIFSITYSFLGSVSIKIFLLIIISHLHFRFKTFVQTTSYLHKIIGRNISS